MPRPPGARFHYEKRLRRPGHYEHGNLPAEPRQGELRFLTEQEPVWAGVLAEVLERNRIPFVKESSMGAGLAIKTGALLETIRFFVPCSRLEEAKDLADGLFAGEADAE